MYLQNCVIVSEINFIIVLFYCKNFIEVLMDFFYRQPFVALTTEYSIPLKVWNHTWLLWGILKL